MGSKKMRLMLYKESIQKGSEEVGLEFRLPVISGLNVCPINKVAERTSPEAVYIKMND
jgi:hypothetical protein